MVSLRFAHFVSPPTSVGFTPADLSRFLDAKRAIVSASTANQTRKCISIFFKRSKLRGYIKENPVEMIRAFKISREEKRTRRPFTQAELATLYKVAPDDFWRYAVLGGFTTGLRLGDLATLPMGAVDWKERSLRLNVRKTGKRIAIPLTAPFFKMLTALKSQRPGAAPTDAFWPKHAERYEKSGGGWFSQRFYDLLLVKAGLAKVRPHLKGTIFTRRCPIKSSRTPWRSCLTSRRHRREIKAQTPSALRCFASMTNPCQISVSSQF